MPNKYTYCHFNLVYTTRNMGMCLEALYQRARKLNPVLLLVEDTHHYVSCCRVCCRFRFLCCSDGVGIVRFVSHSTSPQVFGAFLTSVVRPQEKSEKSYMGTGESFVFSLRPSHCVYKWTQEDTCFLKADETQLFIGGGYISTSMHSLPWVLIQGAAKAGITVYGWMISWRLG